MNSGQQMSLSDEDKETSRKMAVQQIALSVFAVGGSIIGGMYVTARREKMKLRNVIGHGSPAMIASKALLIGSAYSIGSFAVGISLFMMLTGVSSFDELTNFVDKTCRTPEGYRRLMEKREKERLELEALKAKYKHLDNVDLLWKQLRIKEELTDETDVHDDNILSNPAEYSPVPPEEKKEHFNVVLYAVNSIKDGINKVIPGAFAPTSTVRSKSNAGDKSSSSSIPIAESPSAISSFPIPTSTSSSTASSSVDGSVKDNLILTQLKKLYRIWTDETSAPVGSSPGKHDPTVTPGVHALDNVSEKGK